MVISSFGELVGPSILRYPQHEDKQTLFADIEEDNFLWVLLRWHSVPRQIIPSCTGLYITIHEGLPVMK